MRIPFIWESENSRINPFEKTTALITKKSRKKCCDNISVHYQKYIQVSQFFYANIPYGNVAMWLINPSLLLVFDWQGPETTKIVISKAVPFLFRLHWCRWRYCLYQFAPDLNLHCAGHVAPDRCGLVPRGLKVKTWLSHTSCLIYSNLI